MIAACVQSTQMRERRDGEIERANSFMIMSRPYIRMIWKATKPIHSTTLSVPPWRAHTHTHSLYTVYANKNVPELCGFPYSTISFGLVVHTKRSEHFMIHSCISSARQYYCCLSLSISECFSCFLVVGFHSNTCMIV